MHKLLARQLAQATNDRGDVDVSVLTGLVEAAYNQADRDRRRTDRSMSLMIEELDSLNLGLERLVEERTRALRERENELKAQNVRFDTAVNNMSQGLLMFDGGGRLVICNQRYLDMYGLTAEIAKPGCSVRSLYEARKANGTFAADPEETEKELRAAIRNQTSLRRIVDIPDGRTIAVTSDPMPGGGWVTTHQDITERRRVEKQIAHMAHHDALTDLPNRVLFRERLAQALVGARRGHRFAVLCLDLDHFKTVNDTLGHPIGDEMLTMVAARLRKCVRETDTVARLGGDEFAIIQGDVNGPTESAILAQRICESLTAPFDLDGQVVVAGASIGIAIAPDDGAEPDELLKNADLALYRAKGDGRATYRFFETAMDARMKSRREIEMSLRRALASNEFELLYQPLMELDSETVTSCEALIRWHHPGRGLISPADFIPIAEDIGLIVPIGEWVLRKACHDAMRWPSRIKVAVNLSAIQVMNKSLLAMVTSALSASGLPAHRLQLEITETVLMQHTDATLTALHQLRKLGVSICLDDFGTGYSSLKYLRSFPFDKLKIDRCFINDFADSDESIAIVRAIASLAQGLGIETTAEGVETLDQYDQVRALGCTEIQGFFFSPPRRADDVAAFLSSRTDRRLIA